MDTTKRIRALRKALGLTQDQVAAASGGLLRREYLVKLEAGRNRATSDQMRRGLERGFGATREDIDALLDSALPVDQIAGRILARRGHSEWPTLDKPDRYPRRAAVLRLLALDYNPDVVHRVQDLDLGERGEQKSRRWWAERLATEQRIYEEDAPGVVAPRAMPAAGSGTKR